ncbi:MAG: adenylate/guanylate cyclase domain-containing protein [Actinobacteria bacterium]|nr:adenylate/guanylate cyclase domain-containing protein [Actinomycetota bacterium]
MIDVPETRYATSTGGAKIAYQTVGDGPRDLVYAMSVVSNIEVAWENPTIARFFRRLASLGRLILFDKRGSGASDSTEGPATLEHRLDDLRAVLDAVGSDDTVLFGSSEGGATCATFAATYPDRTRALVLYSSAVVSIRDDECPWAWTREIFDAIDANIDTNWATGEALGLMNPSVGDDERERRWYARYWRLSASPARAKAMFRLNQQIDIRPVLGSISVPALVLHRTDETWMTVEFGRYAAAKIPGARLVELPGADHEPWLGDAEAVLAEISEFVTGVRESPEPDRVLATVLFTDIVDSTGRASELGDRRWKELLDRHDSVVRQQVERARGTYVKSTGDGALATFDGPARAIRCAGAIHQSLRGLGLQVRAGLHTGEVELGGNDVAGIAVHLAARVVDQAEPDEVLVSRTVVDLVAGSGLEFADRGAHELKGVPGEWRLYAVNP